MKNKVSKKILICILIVITLFISACSKTVDDPNNEQTQTEDIINTENEVVDNNDEKENETEINEGENMQYIYVTVNGTTLTAKLEDNSSSKALIEKLTDGDITIKMDDYANFEKVGSLGFSLPRNDKQYTTKAGDIILYQGSSLVFYYDTNSWNFTKLGEFQNITQSELKNLFGSGSIEAVISLKNN